MPRPVASSVTNVRSEGMSDLWTPPQRVVPQPFVVATVEQLDEIEDRAAVTGHGIEREVACASPAGSVGGEQDQGQIGPRLVEDRRAPESPPQGLGPLETGSVRGERA